MTRTLITLAIASTLSLGAVAQLQAGEKEHGGRGGHHGMMMGKGKSLEHLTKALDLTAEQQAAVKPIMEQTKPQIRAIHEEAMQKTKAVMENAMAQIRPLLQPEQQQKLEALKSAHEKMREARREMREARQQ